LAQPELALALVHASYVATTLASGFLVRLLVDPSEAAKLKEQIEVLTSQLPPKKARVTRKLEKKARIVESELAPLRRKYTRLSMVRIAVVALVYALGLWFVAAFLPPYFPAPAALPFITVEHEGQAYVPSVLLYVFGLVLLSPLSTKIAEVPRKKR